MNIYVGNLSWSMTDDEAAYSASTALLQAQKFLKKKTRVAAKALVS